jgi:hypothetical protein
LVAHFIVAVALDRFGFLLVELRQLGSGRTVDAQEFVEFGMQCQIVALDEQRHHKYRKRRQGNLLPNACLAQSGYSSDP